MTAPAMLLAAGRGERMRPLTDVTPKPLLLVRGKPLMQWPLEALARAGCTDVVVNTAWLGAQIEAHFGSIFELKPPPNMRDQLSNQEHFWPVQRPTLQMHYSREGQDFGGALETAGGIARALALLDPTQSPGSLDLVFWLLAGDIFAPEFAFRPEAVQRFVAGGKLAHLWLVPNPEHNPRGDFGLTLESGNAADIGLALNLPQSDPRPRFTYSTIGLYRKALFEPPWCAIPKGNPSGLKAPLAPLLRAAMDQHQVSAELYTGSWVDVGTVQRLAAINASQ